MPGKSPSPSTCYIFCYTSGTTGDPKGAMLSHSYFIGCVVAITYYQYNFTPVDTAISYLPYAHLFEQAILCSSLFLGFKHGYYQGNPLLLFDDIAELKPTMLVTVPRILNRIYTKVLDEISHKGKCVQSLFHSALTKKTRNLETKEIGRAHV